MSASILIVATALFFALQAEAYKKIQNPIDQILQAKHLDKDRLELLIQVTYTDGCTRESHTIVRIHEETKIIELYHAGQKITGECKEKAIPQYSTVQFVRPQNGLYTVIDLVNSRTLGRITIIDHSVQVLTDL